MHTFAKKPKATQQTTSAKSPKPSRLFVGQSYDVHSILHLHRTIGNQAVLRLLKTATENIDANSASRTSTGISHDFSRIPLYPGTRNTVQPKLKVNAPKDRYEQEADRIADKVLRQKMSEEEDEKVQIQGRASQQAAGGENEVNEEIENRLSRSKGGGNPISDQVRSIVEPRMQFDFSKVQVHTDNEAARMNEELGARAFTHGRDIYFGAHQYSPQSIEGKRLLAHELTHVVQQSEKQKLGLRNQSYAQKAYPPSRSSIIQLNPLSTEQRRAKVRNIGLMMPFVYTDITNGAQDAETAIRVAATARANVAKAIFSVGMALIVPGFGGLVAGAAGRFSITVARETASTIGSAVGDAAKSAGNSAIDTAFSSSPGHFFIAIENGFERAAHTEFDWINGNVGSPDRLPDAVLVDLDRHWTRLSQDYDRAAWSDWFQRQWTRYQQQIVPIGTTGTAEISTGRYTQTRTGVVWVAIGGEHVLVLATAWRIGSSQLRFERWIDRDLKELALSQARQRHRSGSIPEVTPANFITTRSGRLPSSVPNSATRR